VETDVDKWMEEQGYSFVTNVPRDSDHEYNSKDGYRIVEEAFNCDGTPLKTHRAVYRAEVLGKRRGGL
jgi:hypothetical protein